LPPLCRCVAAADVRLRADLYETAQSQLVCDIDNFTEKICHLHYGSG